MNKQEIYNYLNDLGIWYEVTEHEAVFNMEEVSHIDMPYPEADGKNIFVRDDKKQNYYLITVKGDKRVDLKEFRRKYETRNLSFASSDDLMEILGLIPGAVTPLGLLNDKKLRVRFYLDKAFENGLVGVHPNENTATVWIKCKDLIEIIKKHGNDVYLTEL